MPAELSKGLRRFRDDHFPSVLRHTEAGELFLHGWHYILEEYAVKNLDLDSGRFPLQEPTPPALVAWGDDLTEAGACHG